MIRMLAVHNRGCTTTILSFSYKNLMGESLRCYTHLYDS